MIRAVIFDWGDTLMRDMPSMPGPMVTWPHVEAIAGASAALSELRASGFILCVASNAGASNAELMGQALERVDLRRHFDHLWTSKELGAAKPEPEFFLAAARRIGFEPKQCLMVGNDYAKDICGAKAAGLHTVWLASAADEGRPTPAADVTIRGLAELPPAVSTLATPSENL